MTVKDEKYNEAEIAVTGVEPVVAAQQIGEAGPPIPAGHSRFYCEKCHTVSGASVGPLWKLNQH
jgi:hypothetical protein